MVGGTLTGGAQVAGGDGGGNTQGMCAQCEEVGMVGGTLRGCAQVAGGDGGGNTQGRCAQVAGGDGGGNTQGRYAQDLGGTLRGGLPKLLGGHPGSWLPCLWKQRISYRRCFLGSSLLRTKIRLYHS